MFSPKPSEDATATNLELVHDELGGLSGRVDDEREAVEALEHDGVLGAQVVGRQSVGLPAQPLVRVRQVLGQRYVRPVLDVGHLSAKQTWQRRPISLA